MVYFSVPETDGVDASSGASRVKGDGGMMGNTQYIASIISKATVLNGYAIERDRVPESEEGINKWLKKIFN